MPRDSNGLATRVVPPGAAGYQTGTDILPSEVNGEVNDVYTLLTGSIASNGTTTPTANLKMGGYKHTNAAAASAGGEYMEYTHVNTLVAAKANKGANTDITSMNAVTGIGRGNTTQLTLNVDGISGKFCGVNFTSTGNLQTSTIATPANGVLYFGNDLLHYVHYIGASTTFLFTDNVAVNVGNFTVSSGYINVCQGASIGKIYFGTGGVNNLNCDGTYFIPSLPLKNINAAKAWAKFDGTLAGTNAPTLGSNVTNINRTGTGTYTVTMTTAITANYSVNVTCSAPTVPLVAMVVSSGQTTSSFTIQTFNLSGTLTDCTAVHFQVFSTG